MLSGDNGILQQTTTARTRTIHANVLEQMQLEASAYTVDKTTGNYSNSLIDYLKSKSIISDISGEEDKWLINVTTLLGSNQSMGNGTYPNDVYVLEKQDTSTGSIVSTRVATTIPIKIATTSTTQITYKVEYYGNTTSENLTLGDLFDDNLKLVADESEKLKDYFNSPDSYDSNGNLVDNDTIGIKVSDLYFLDNISTFKPPVVIQYLSYNNSIYKSNRSDETVTKIDSNLNLNKFGEYTVDGINVLVDSNKNIYKKQEVSGPNKLNEGKYMDFDSETQYYYTDGGKIDYDRPFVGFAAKYYDEELDESVLIFFDADGNVVVDNVAFGGYM